MVKARWLVRQNEDPHVAEHLRIGELRLGSVYGIGDELYLGKSFRAHDHADEREYFATRAAARRWVEKQARKHANRILKGLEK